MSKSSNAQMHMHDIIFTFACGKSRRSWITVVQEYVQLICKCKGSILKEDIKISRKEELEYSQVQE